MLTVWEPWIKEVAEFGDEKYTADCVYPREDQILEMPRDEIVRLSEIRYKPSD